MYPTISDYVQSKLKFLLFAGNESEINRPIKADMMDKGIIRKELKIIVPEIPKNPISICSLEL